jgi:hypothetical protein
VAGDTVAFCPAMLMMRDVKDGQIARVGMGLLYPLLFDWCRVSSKAGHALVCEMSTVHRVLRVNGMI